MSEPAYTLDDPRPIAVEAPYTFFLPSNEELAAIEPGDIVKLIFRPRRPGRNFFAERMWVVVERAEGDDLEGRLNNIPDDIPGLALDDKVRFCRFHVISCDWGDERATPPPDPQPERGYWERCMVDSCVVKDGVQVHYLYRESPDPEFEQGDKFPDSGWRIRGDYRGLSDEEIEARDGDFVALGAVLNVDDSWIDLIDEPIGSAFIRNWETGQFVPEE